MKTITLKLLIALLFLGVTFTSCDDDDDVIRGLEDRDITIDADQTFNMKNFIASLEQVKYINDPMTLNLLGYTHLVDNGKALESYLNYKVFGKFGGPLITFKHNFNASGVVVSTTINNESYFNGSKSAENSKTTADSNQYEEATYKFDNKGYITKIMISNGSDVFEELNLEYNTLYQVIKIEHVGLETKVFKLPITLKKEIVASTDKLSKTTVMSNTWDEIFEKDSNGNITKYATTRRDTGDYYKYIFDTNNRNVKLEFYNDNILDDTTIFEYDSSNRLIKLYEEDDADDRTEFKFTNDYMSIINYYTRNGNLLLDEIQDFAEGFKLMKSWDFRYDYETTAFEYCKAYEYSYNDNYEYPLNSKKEYFEGTPENLVLVGYTTIDTRDPANDYRETKESIYNADGTLLYYVEYEVENNSIQSHKVYKADGTESSDYEVREDLPWIGELIYRLRS